MNILKEVKLNNKKLKEAIQKLENKINNSNLKNDYNKIKFLFTKFSKLRNIK